MEATQVEDETKFEKAFREFKEDKLLARKFQGEVSKLEKDLAEHEDGFDEATRVANAAYQERANLSDVQLRNDLGEIERARKAARTLLRSAEEGLAKVRKRMDSRVEDLPGQLNDDMRNQ